MTMTENGLKLLDIIVKGVIGTAIGAAVGFYGYVMQDDREREREQTRQVQATIELTSKQKDLDVELAMRMFSTLMGYYFEKTGTVRTETLRRQMLLLRLVAMNFQDVPIHLRPLFEDLDRQLTSEKDRQELRGIAQEVAKRQAYRLTIEGGLDSGPRKVTAGTELRFPELLTTLKVEAVSKDSVRASIVSEVARSGSVGPFTVGFFDLPIVDNTKLGEYRVALLLHSAGEREAQVRFVAFPKHLAADRFDIKELSRALRDKQPAS